MSSQPINGYLQAIDDMAGKLLETIRRFPLALFSAFIFVLLMIFEMYKHDIGGDILDKISFIALLSFFFFVSLRLMTKSWLVSLLGVVAVVAFYLYIPDSLNEYMRQAEGKMKLPMIIATLLSLMIVAPFLTSKISNRVFFEWLKHLLYMLFLSAIVSLILYIILMFGLKTIDDLFDITIKHFVFSQIGFFSFAFVSSFFFLSQIPKEPRMMRPTEYNKVEKIFVKYLLTTLSVVYFLIISTYTIKMIFLGEYPKGVVSWNIVAFSMLAILTYLFWTPLWSEQNQKYKKIIWIAILLQIVLLATALYLRVEPYGWTINRLLLGSLALLFLVVSLYGIIKGEISYQVMFVSVPLIIALNLMFSSIISKSSQQERLKELLANTSTLSDESNLSLRYNISSKIDYLYQHHGTEALLPIMPLIVTEFENRDKDTDNCTAVAIQGFQDHATESLGFKYIDKWNWKNHIRNKEEKNSMKHYGVVRYQEEMNITNYDWIVPFSHQQRAKFDSRPLCPPVDSETKEAIFKIITEGNELIIKEQKEIIARVDLEKFIVKVLGIASKDKAIVSRHYRNDFTKEEFTHYYQNDKVKVKLMFKHFMFSSDDQLVEYEGEVLIGRE